MIANEIAHSLFYYNGHGGCKYIFFWLKLTVRLIFWKLISKMNIKR